MVNVKVNINKFLVCVKYCSNGFHVKIVLRNWENFIVDLKRIFTVFSFVTVTIKSYCYFRDGIAVYCVMSMAVVIFIRV